MKYITFDELNKINGLSIVETKDVSVYWGHPSDKSAQIIKQADRVAVYAHENKKELYGVYLSQSLPPKLPVGEPTYVYNGEKIDKSKAEKLVAIGELVTIEFEKYIEYVNVTEKDFLAQAK